MNKHYREIDVFKGIAIAMVMLGHAIIVYPINLNTAYSWCNYLHWFVSSAHMVMFSALSGFCFGFHDWKSYLTKKAKRILVPFVVFAVLGIFVNKFLGSLINDPKSIKESLIGILTGSSNWFLYTLFIIFLIFPFILKVFENRKAALILICAFGILQLFSFWPTMFCIDRVVKYIFYFSVGYYFKLESKKESKLWTQFIAFVKKPLVWLVSLIIWIPLVFVLIKLENRLYLLYALVSIITALVGMVNIISFGFIVSKISISKLFEETGKVSLQLFLFNGYFLTLTRTVTVKLLHITSPVIIIAANVIMMYFVSYVLIHFVIKKVKLFRVLTGMV